MAADAFNSAGGFSVGIPPVPVIDLNGNITAPRATIAGNIAVGGNVAVSGAITATNFYGNVQGNITANITIIGPNNALLFNSYGLAATADSIKYDPDTKSVTVEENFTANNFSLGLGDSQFYNISSFVATTNSANTDQVLHKVLATTNNFSLGLGDSQFYNISSFVATTNSANTDQVLHKVLATTVCSMDYTIIATDAVANTRQTSKLIASVLGNDVGYYEYGTIDAPVTSPGVGDFRVNFEPGNFGGNVTLTVTPRTAHLTNYKILITSYKA